jgi:hypothetical protein
LSRAAALTLTFDIFFNEMEGKKMRRYFNCLLVALCMAAAAGRLAGQQKFSPAEQELVDVRAARIEAIERRDLAVWSRYVADDCILSDDDGNLISKAQLMEHLKLPPGYDRSVNPRDFVVHLYGNTAVMNYRVTAHEQFTDTDIISEQRVTETYIKKNRSWLLVARQWENLPVNFRKPIEVDTSAYKDYVGQYEWRPGTTDNIIMKDGKLWSEMGVDADECLPRGGETFFFKDDLGSISFSRDAGSHVTGYIYHRVDGQEIHAKRIK